MKNVNFFCYDSLFSSRLRKLIKDENISMQTLSSEIGVSRQAISQYCDGSTVPNADKLLKIAEYFNVSLDYLVGRTDVFTTDKDIQYICKYTGLNENTVKTLNNSLDQKNVFASTEWNDWGDDYIYNFSEMVNLMFSDYSFLCLFCSNLMNYLDEQRNKERFYYIYSKGNIPLGIDFTNLFLMGMQQQLKEFKDRYISKQHDLETDNRGFNNNGND